ncbi:Fc.00g023180.m01.CDS01 [Cosmosporella sp. VM-42]
MDSSLHEVWQAAAGSPFFPVVQKDSQFWVGFLLLLLGLILTGVFGLNRSLVNVPVLGVPASLAVAFGVVYMFCAVGVYV